MKPFIAALELAWILAPPSYKERIRLIMQDAKQQIYDEDEYA